MSTLTSIVIVIVMMMAYFVQRMIRIVQMNCLVCFTTLSEQAGLVLIAMIIANFFRVFLVI